LRDIEKRILKRSEVQAAADRLRSAGLTIVFTNGCFDVLHAGHVHVLRMASSMGDRLIVGVNTDSSVARLKGDRRPLNKLEDRLEMLSEMRSVDYVVPFDEDTPAELIREVRPDVLVKGGDYSAEEVAGAEFVASCGGRVEIVPLLEGYSTTGTIERLRNS
jgi:D-beta-D-heptose 7-phosphate kinase / D-beta-D-heptose 1-phosphate adenosyltransferase